MHKERIFSASSGSHRGTSSGNMKSCPLCLCVVFSCPLLIFPSLPPFPVLRSQAPPRGGRTERSLFLWNARARARRAERPRCFRAARPVLGRAGPSRVADPVCLPAVPPRRRFRLSLPSAPARLRVAFFAAPCGAFRRELLPYPMQCVAPRSARRRPCASSSLLSLPRFLPGLSVLRPLPGVAHAIRDSPADSAVARPQLRSVSVYLAALRPVAFPSDPRLPVVSPVIFSCSLRIFILPRAPCPLSSVLASLSCFSPSAGSRGGPGA